MRTKILIFGATGSVGKQALDIISKSKNMILCGFSYHSNKTIASKIKTKYKNVSVLKTNGGINEKEIKDFISKCKPDLIVNAVVGFAGINYTLASVKSKIDLALANKESLVCAGQFIIPLAKKNKVNIYPIDSEHSALYQLLHHRWKRPVFQSYITASGGPFWDYDKTKLENVTFKQAIKNPNWKMGEKVSIDSATLINKAYEAIEAYWLFDHIKVNALVQRKSLVHAFAQLDNNELVVYESKADMHWPIELALNKYMCKDKNMKLYKSIEDIPYKLIPIKHAHLKGYEYARLMFKNPKSAIPVIINAADEEAIKLFKENKIKFLDIYEIINKAINEFKDKKIRSIEDVYKIDDLIRSGLKKYWSRVKTLRFHII
ncbi:MAG: 1-deoxy-D-xylulose 5-phosphate reductoisomerase [Malacoplasma sp.]|nr:1-deoxy-D-xylulose 5-phosphate reductoisomerase [Malacoplasma sp.]